ncbi:MAG: hypothetical protein LUD74_08290 [Tannerellaceae bacterium]|nr:hypothetical protein [Tannerellaceae bacterium]
MKQHLANGNTVHLGEFGSFRVTAGSGGVEDPEDFHPSMFRKPRIVFTPGTMLRDTPELGSFKKVEVRKVAEICNRPHAV